MGGSSLVLGLKVGLYLDSVFVEGAGVGGKNVLEFFFFFYMPKLKLTFLSFFCFILVA